MRTTGSAGLGTGVPGSVVGVGIDAVEVERIRAVLARRPGLVGRLFTDEEQRYASRSRDSAARMATRFAAKEATMKALGAGIGSMGFAEVEVVRVGVGAPALVLHGSALARAERAGVERWHLSLTHTDTMAMAFVVAEGPGTAWPGAAGGARAGLTP